MAINHKPGVPGVLNTSSAGRLPVEVTETGTISHTNNTLLVIGVGTLFSSKLKVGQWIYANSVLRKITHIESDTRLLVDATFGADLTGADLKTCQSGVYRNKNREGTCFGSCNSNGAIFTCRKAC